MRFHHFGRWMCFSTFVLIAPLACGDPDDPKPKDTEEPEGEDLEGSGGSSTGGMGGSADTPSLSGLNCDDLEGCAQEGVTCDGDELVVCAELFEDCLVETRTDCAAQPDGSCGDVGTLAACTLPEGSPCAGKDLCTEEGMACSDDDSAVVKCARDEDGCLVAEPMECQLGTACDEAVCVATCEDAKLCGDGPGKFCGAEGQLMDCRDADSDGCLDALVDSCEASQFCAGSAGDATCSSEVSSCAAPLAISGLGAWTYRGVSIAANGNLVDLSGTDCTARPNAYEMVFEVALEAGQTVKVNEFSSLDAVLSIQTGTCGSGTCLESNDFGEETTGASYTATGAETVYAIVENWETSDSEFDVTITTSVCGDGVITEHAETCDDMNGTSDDGCSECQIDPGFLCSSAPSTCMPTDGGSYGAGEALPAWPLDVLLSGGDFFAEVTFTENVTLVGSARDPAADLDVAIRDVDGDLVKSFVADGDEAIYVQLPAGTYAITVTAIGTPTAPAISLATTGGLCGDGLKNGQEGCDDANALSADGCRACVVESKFVCGGEPSTCAPYWVSYDKYFDDGFIVDSSTVMTYPQSFWSSCTIGNTYIRVAIDHDYRGDLDMRVRSPAGTWVILSRSGVDANEDFIGVFPLDFATVGNLADFNGQTSYGEWILEIVDDGPEGSGWIDDWEIYVACQ